MVCVRCPLTPVHILKLLHSTHNKNLSANAINDYFHPLTSVVSWSGSVKVDASKSGITNYNTGRLIAQYQYNANECVCYGTKHYTNQRLAITQSHIPVNIPPNCHTLLLRVCSQLFLWPYNTHTMLGVILLRIVHLLQVHSQIDKRYKIVIFFKNEIQNLQATISIWEWGGKRVHPVNEEWHIKRNHTNTLIKLLHTKSELNVFLVLPLVWLQGDFVRINFHNSKFLCKQECASL